MWNEREEVVKSTQRVVGVGGPGRLKAGREVSNAVRTRLSVRARAASRTRTLVGIGTRAGSATTSTGSGRMHGNGKGGRKGGWLKICRMPVPARSWTVVREASPAL